MKRLLALLLLLPMLAIAAPHDLVISQRNADDSGLAPSRRMSPPTDGSSALLAYNGGTTQLPTMWRLGAGLTLSNGVLSATPAPMSVAWGDVTGKPASYPSTLALVAGLQSALDGKLAAPTGTADQYLQGDGTLANFPTIPAAQVRPDWNAISGMASIDNKPALAPMATAGTYTSLTGVPTTFPPAAHSQAWSTITSTPTTLAGYGITDAYPLTGNPSGFLTSISSGQVTAALGFTPYNATNPSGYVTQAGVRSAITLTTTGTSGAATYNSTTGALNIPSYTTPSTPSINDNPGRALVATTAATGFQVSATRVAHVCYEGSFSTTSTIGGPSSASVFLETADTNSTTPGDWTTKAQQTYSNTITLAIVLNQVQGNNWSMCRYIPAGKFVRIRVGSITGTASATINAAQQEVLL